MTTIIFLILIILALKFGGHSYRQGDRQIPPIMALVAVVLFIIFNHITMLSQSTAKNNFGAVT